MSKEDRDRADARFDKAARVAGQAKAGGNDRDAGSKAVLDNMARLKALRLAREATAPPAAAKKPRAKSSTASSTKKTVEKSQVLAEWLAGRQSGGFRT
ncbi:MAG: hypothetical protein V4517_05400 [Pseudomonadota bacterium]|jgi:hypothetical protein